MKVWGLWITWLTLGTSSVLMHWAPKKTIVTHEQRLKISTIALLHLSHRSAVIGYNHLKTYTHSLREFLAPFVFTQLSYCRVAGVRFPSVYSVFSDTTAWIQAKLYEKLPITDISRPFPPPQIFNVQILCFFFSFSSHGTLWELKFQNATPLTNRSRIVSNFS